MASPPSVYFIPNEVVVHNSVNDMWIIVHKMVFDLTNLFKKRSDTMNDVSVNNYRKSIYCIISFSLQNLHLLLGYAGKDLSWAFDERERNPMKRINQNFESVPVFPPVYEKESDESEFWWHDKNIIGQLTSMERRIRVINTLTKKIIFMNVCEEDTLHKIRKKYSKTYNSNDKNYVWCKTSTKDKISGRLYTEKTLTQNGIDII